MEILKAFNSLLFPTRDLCFYCKEKAYDIEGFLCKTCLKNIQIVNREFEINAFYIDRAYYSTIYNEFMRKLVQDFKFHGKSYLYRPLAYLMLETLNEIEEDIDKIFYVPSHRKKEAKRGYNHAELLASYISKHRDLPISRNNLVKIKNTRPQNKLDKKERIFNLIDSFKVRDKREVRGKTILLIDDIITTGSTMRECAETLYLAGAKEIIGLALTSSHK